MLGSQGPSATPSLDLWLPNIRVARLVPRITLSSWPSLSRTSARPCGCPSRSAATSLASTRDAFRPVPSQNVAVRPRHPLSVLAAEHGQKWQASEKKLCITAIRHPTPPRRPARRVRTCRLMQAAIGAKCKRLRVLSENRTVALFGCGRGEVASEQASPPCRRRDWPCAGSPQ